jgi:1-deoxy-D-xylulose-5-phosphate synthase
MAAEPRILPLGKGHLVAGEADAPGVLVASAGTVLEAVLDAARRAGKSGIQCSVFDVRYVKPMDRTALLDLCSRATGLVTVEENALAGGFGAAVVEALVDARARPLPVRRLGLPDEFIEHGSQGELRSEVGLDADGIFRAIEAVAEAARRDS